MLPSVSITGVVWKAHGLKPSVWCRDFGSVEICGTVGVLFDDIRVVEAEHTQEA